MRDVLVAYASKMGSTKEIAEAIGVRLVQRGLRVSVQDASSVDSMTEYSAVVLGSAVYMGRWRQEAVQFVRRHAAELSPRRTWLFESGWVGERPEPPTATPGGRRRAHAIGSPAPAVFPGRLDPALATGFLDRSVAKRTAGDSRDWGEIERWADQVADALAVAHTSTDQGRPS